MANGSGSFDALDPARATHRLRTRREAPETRPTAASNGTFAPPMNPAQIEEIVRRLVANPDDGAALHEAHTAGQTDPKGYATVLERAGEGARDASYAAYWLSEAAQVYSFTLGDARRAATLLMRALEKDPASDVASERLAELYREKGDHRALVALYERRAKALAALAADPQRAQQLSMLHEELGRMWSEPPLSQPKKALENYKKAFEVDPSAVAAIYAARELLKAQGDFKDAIPLYELEARQVDDPARRLALARDEATVRQQAGDLVGASQALRNARNIDPEDPGLAYELASSVLTRISGGDTVSEDERDEAAAILVSMAEQYEGEHALAYSEAALDAMPSHDRAMQLAAFFAQPLERDVSARWAKYLEVSPDGVLALDGRKALSRAYEAQGRLDEAVSVLEPVKDDPDPSVVVRLQDLYARGARAAEPSEPMTMKPPPPAPPPARAQSAPPAPQAPAPVPEPPPPQIDPGSVNRLLEAAAAAASKNDRRGALTKYREVLATDAQHPEALSYVEDALRASRQYKDLREVLIAAARVGGAPIDSRKMRLREVAGLSESQLKDPEGAIAAYKQLLSLDRSDEVARNAMHRLLEKTQHWDDLAQLLEQEAMQAGDPEERIALERKLADLHEHKRGDKKEAAEALIRILGQTPKDEEILTRAVALFSAAGDAERAAQAIDDGIPDIDDGPVKAKLLARLGELRTQLGDAPAAADAWNAAAEILDDAATWKQLEDAGVAAERWDYAATAAGKRAEHEKTPAAQAVLRSTEADYLVRAGDAKAAVERLELALEIAPEDEALATKLEQLLEQEGRFDDVAALLEKRADGAKDEAKSIALLKRCAAFRRERLADPNGARDLLLKIVGTKEDAEALGALVDDAIERGEAQAATAYLRRLEKIATTKEDRLKIALREAGLLADAVGDVDGALSRYREILTGLDENCREALQAIADMEEARENFAAAADALERELELANAGDEKATVGRRLGEIYVDKTHELGKAIAAYEVVVKEDGEDFAALSKLRELSERAEKWPRVVEIIEAQIDVEGDDEEIASLAGRRAEILADQLGKVEDALRDLAPYTAAGSDVARAAALAIADRHEAHAQIGGQILAWARTTQGPDGQRLLGEAFDRFVRGNVEDRALEIAPDVLRTARAKDQAFLERLEPLAVAAKNLDLVLEVHDRRASLTSGAARAEELVRQAQARIDLGVSREDAVSHGELGLSAVPPLETPRLLYALAAMAPSAMAAIELYERQVARNKTPPDRLAALVRVYRAALERAPVAGAELAAVEKKAQEVLELTLAVQNADDPADALWASVAEADASAEGDSYRRALVAGIVGSSAGPRDGGRTRSAQLRKLAVRAKDELGDLELAFDLLGKALVAHVDAVALDALEEAAGEDAKRAEAVLSRVLEEVFDGPIVRQVLARRALLRQEKLADFDGALADLRRLHELAPADQGITERYGALLREANDFRGLVQLLEDQILRSKDQAVRADLARQIAHIWEEKLGEPREAADAWRRVLRLKAGDPEATEGLDRAKRNKLKFDPAAVPAPRAVSVPPPKPSTPPPAPRNSAAPAAAPSLASIRRSTVPPPPPPPAPAATVPSAVPSTTMQTAPRASSAPPPPRAGSRPPGPPPSRPPSRPPIPKAPAMPAMSMHDAPTDVTAETPAMTHLGLPPAGSFDSEQTISGEMLLMRESSSRLAAKTEEMQAYSPSMLEPSPPASGEEAEMVADDEVEDVEDVDDVDDLEEVEELTSITDPRGSNRK
jgi:hypothetical protein